MPTSSNPGDTKQMLSSNSSAWVQQPVQPCAAPCATKWNLEERIMTFPTIVFLQDDGNTARQVSSCVPDTWGDGTRGALAETASCVLGPKHPHIHLAHHNITGYQSRGECSPESSFWFRGLSFGSFCGLSLQEI